MIHIFLCDDDSSYLEYLSEIVDREEAFRKWKQEGMKYGGENSN